MPSIGFVLPHWLYWLGLAVFPLIAMALARVQKPASSESYSMPTAYFVWLVGGFLGLHRLYLKNVWGMAYWPLFAIILFASSVERSERVIVSDARSELEVVDSSIARNERRIEKSQKAISDTQAQLSETAADDERRRNRLERKITKETERIEKAEANISSIKADVSQLETNLSEAEASQAFWSSIARYTFFGVLAFLLLDLVLMPAMKRSADVKLAANPGHVVEREELPDDRELAGSGLAGVFDRISLFCGEYVAFWSVLAVFVYYYEVLVRYVFNSPTNWAHESMFLMFGMQYLVAGSYAMLTESHVRVDIFYARMSTRGKAFIDLLTSIFFFIFAGTLLVTGWIFASDAMQGTNWEVSFTEWAIQYWPVKIVIGVGALLLILQGLSKVLKDLAVLLGSDRSVNGRTA